jgi:hypothetical protein
MTVRHAFENHGTLGPTLLEAVKMHAIGAHAGDIRAHRLTAFGVFYPAQLREPHLLEPLIRLFETLDHERQDEGLFPVRTFFFGHRLLAGVCPSNSQRLLELALDTSLKPLTRALAICAIGLLGVYGDVPRANAVMQLRATFKVVKDLREEWTSNCWARTTVKLHTKEFEREVQWFLASGRLSLPGRQQVAAAMRAHPDDNFISVVALDPMADVFCNVFPREMRNGELGLVPNGQIPDLELYGSPEPDPGSN